MNIVYLIGNGFDIKLGLKTSYKNFYEWYENHPTTGKNPRILSFIRHIREKEKVDKDWADMELALGKYTKEFKSDDIVEEAKSFHDDLVEAISEFIKAQETELSVKDNAEELLCRYLTHPEEDPKRLLPLEFEAFRSYRNIWANSSLWSLNIISINYTTTIKNLLKYDKEKNIGNYFSSGKGPIVLNEIEHVHGYTDERLILGVNDESQVANEKLHSTNAMNWYVKSKYNDLCKLGHHTKCQTWIENANLVCVFGFSLGATDKQWWGQIVSRMRREGNCWLILFYYNPDLIFTGLKSARLDECKNSYKNTFLDRAGVELTDKEKESIKSRIYVSYNSNMFSLISNKESLEKIG